MAPGFEVRIWRSLFGGKGGRELLETWLKIFIVPVFYPLISTEREKGKRERNKVGYGFAAFCSSYFFFFFDLVRWVYRSVRDPVTACFFGVFPRTAFTWIAPLLGYYWKMVF